MHDTDGHDDHVAALTRGALVRVAQPVDLVVDRRVLLDVGVAREVGLGLVVVVVGDEVLDPVVREELPELAGQLRGQRLVGRDHEGGLLHLLDRPGGGGVLPEPVMPRRVWKRSPWDAVGQRLDRLGLVAGRREVRHDPERW